MNQDIQKLVTLHNRHMTIDCNSVVSQYSFTMYRRFINYYVRPFQSKYGVLLQGFVQLETYGLIVTQHINLDGVIKVNEVDVGSLSVHQYEVNGLIHQLCRMKVPTEESIELLILSETINWTNRMRGNPFDKAAEEIIKRKVREELSVSRPLVESISEQEARTKRIQMCLLRQQFKKLE